MTTATETKQEKAQTDGYNIAIEDMAKAGLHIGHVLSRIHPGMKPYVYGMKNGVHIIDLEKSADLLRDALSYVQSLAAEGKQTLLVGTKIQHRHIIANAGQETGMPYVTERWLGGTFTNFDEVRKRIEYYQDLRHRLESGAMEKYTKKERLDAQEEMEKLAKKFGGLEPMTSLPAAVFICDMHRNDIAWKEAHNTDVSVLGMADTNVDPEVADYPIPGNDDASPAVEYVVDRLKRAILKGKQQVTEDTEAA